MMRARVDGCLECVSVQGACTGKPTRNSYSIYASYMASRMPTITGLKKRNEAFFAACGDVNNVPEHTIK